MPTSTDKVRELRIRRAAARLGYALQKSRCRLADAPDFGLFRIVDPFCNVVIAGARPWDFSWTLDDVEEWLAT